jgi:4-amino-4-deoxy-L-arabinose transferase-like glycosyltransferase
VRVILKLATRYSFILWAVLLVFSLKLGADLRKIGYNVIPDPFIILDEHANVWHGLSIRDTGVPAAWSILSAYIAHSEKTGAGGAIDGFSLTVADQKPNLKNFSSYPKPVIGIEEYDFGRGLSHTRIVQPYLDHPPLGALALSMFVSKDAKTFGDVNNFDLRRTSLYLAIITQILIFVLALLITKKPLVGIIAATAYATIPSYLLLTRYALLENVLTPLLLLDLILLVIAKRKSSKALLIAAGILGGLMALTKLAGWVFILAFVALLAYWRFKIKDILLYAIPAVLVGLIYFAWGLYLAPQLFLDLFVFQSLERGFIGSINLLVTFFRVGIFNFPLDGWWIGGFVALLLIPRKKEYLPMVFAVVAALVSALVLVGANFPWYFIPLIPFACIAIGQFLYDLATSPTFANIMISFFVFVSSSFYWGYGVFQKSQPFNIYRIMFILFLAAGSFWALYKKAGKYHKIWFVAVMLLLLMLMFLNRRSLFFILDNWGKFPLIYTPGTF